MANTFFNTNYATSTITLTNSNLTATITNSNGGVALSPDAYSTGKFYFEVTINDSKSDVNLGIGIGDTGSRFASSGPSSGAACFIEYNNATIYANKVNTGSSLGSIFANGDVLGIAVDTDNKLVWFRKGSSGNWNGSPSADPATGTGGISYTTSNPVSPLINFGNNSSGQQVTANFGDTSFTGSVPSGFTSGWTTYFTFPTPNQTFSPFLRTTNVTLSNSNLTAKVTNTAGGVALSYTPRSSGRYYFEVTINAGVADGNFAIGVGDINSVYGSSGPQYGAVCFVYWNNSQIYANRSGKTTNLGSLFANGDVIGVAVDIDTKKIWFRKGAAGNWNGNASYDPVSEVGGVSFTFPSSIAPLINFGNTTNEQVTANFGATAFAGTVPSGYAEGWTSTTPAPSTTVMNAAQFGVETWVSPAAPAVKAAQFGVETWVAPPAPAMSAAQSGAEVWVSPPTPAMSAAQTGVEVWTSVASAVQTMYTTTVKAETWLQNTPVADVSTVAAETWVKNEPNVRISTVAIEAWISSNLLPNSAFITTVGTEAWVKDTSKVDVTTVSSEVWLAQPPPGARVTDVKAETWLQDLNANLIVTQAGLDVWAASLSNARISQASLEVWTSSDVVATETKMRATYVGTNVITSNNDSFMYTSTGAVDVIASNVPSDMYISTVGMELILKRNSKVNVTSAGVEVWMKTAPSEMHASAVKINILSPGAVSNMDVSQVGTSIWTTSENTPSVSMRVSEVNSNIWVTYNELPQVDMKASGVETTVWATLESLDPTFMQPTQLGVTVWASVLNGGNALPSNPILMFGL